MWIWSVGHQYIINVRFNKYKARASTIFTCLHGLPVMILIKPENLAHVIDVLVGFTDEGGEALGADLLSEVIHAELRVPNTRVLPIYRLISGCEGIISPVKYLYGRISALSNRIN